MKKLAIIFCSLIAATVVATPVIITFKDSLGQPQTVAISPISDYPNTNNLASNVLFVVAFPHQTNYNISFGQLTNLLSQQFTITTNVYQITTNIITYLSNYYAGGTNYTYITNYASYTTNIYFTTNITTTSLVWVTNDWILNNSTLNFYTNVGYVPHVIEWYVKCVSTNIGQGSADYLVGDKISLESKQMTIPQFNTIYYGNGFGLSIAQAFCNSGINIVDKTNGAEVLQDGNQFNMSNFQLHAEYSNP